MAVIGARPRYAGEQKVKRYDFRRPDKFSKDQIRTLEILHRGFARAGSAALSAALRLEAVVELELVDQCTYGEYVGGLPASTVVAILDLPPLPGPAILQIDNALALASVDRFFGGSGAGPAEERDATVLERVMLSGLVEHALLGALVEAWRRVVELRPTVRAVETNPRWPAVLPDWEMIIMVAFAAGWGRARGKVTMAIPYLALEPLIPRLSARFWHSAGGEGPGVAGSVAADGIQVDAALYRRAEPLSLRRLGALRRGTLVRVSDQAVLALGGRDLLALGTGPGGGFTVERGAAGLAARPQGRGRAEADPGVDSIRAVVRSGLEELERSVGRMAARQDELADQLLLGAEARAGDEGIDMPRPPFGFIGIGQASVLGRLLADEHPQTAALVASLLEPQVAAAALEGLSPGSLQDVVRRIATMERTAPPVVEALGRHLRERLRILSRGEMTQAGGIPAAVAILGAVSRSAERAVVEDLGRSDPELAEEIKRQMFVFEDLVLLDRDTIRAIAGRVAVDELALALKAADPAVREHILAGAQDREALELAQGRLGRRRLDEVEAAQQRIVAAVRQMEEDGEIRVMRPDEGAGE